MILTKRAENLMQQLIIQNRDLQELLVRQQRDHIEQMQKLTEALIAATNRPALAALRNEPKELNRPAMKPRYPGYRPLPDPPRPSVTTADLTSQLVTGASDE